MISLHDNYLPRKYPTTGNPNCTTEKIAALHNNLVKAVTEEHQNHVNSEFQKAIIAKCGELPSVEEMAARGQCFITPEGVYMLAWDHPPIGLGEKVDMDYVIATVEAPKI